MKIEYRRLVVGAAVAAASLSTAVVASARAGDAARAGSRTLVIGSNVAPPTLDPTVSPSAAIDEVFDYNVYQHLAQLTPSGNIVPVLATGWTVSKNGRTYTFHIRPNVKFSNGDPLTAADVVFSIKRVIAPKSNYPYKGLMADVTGVNATGPLTVKVTLKKRSWDWLYYYAAYSNGVILDPKTVSKLATKPVGTGPFMFKGEVPNYSVSLVRNPNYWGAKTNIGAVTFRYFATANAENSALQSGQINVIDNAINPLDIGTFAHNPQYVVIHGLTNGKIQVTVNNTAGPLKNKLVRQAIEYAVNRRAIITNAGGYGVPIYSGTVPGDPWYLNQASTYPYSPSKAKALLKQAGFPNGISLTLTLPPYGYATEAGTIVAAELDAVGIKTTIKDIQWPLWLSQVFTNHSYQLTIVDHVETRDIANYGNPQYYWNYAGTKAVARLEAAGDAAATKAKWIADYHKVVRMINSDAVNTWLYDPDQVTIAQRGIVGLPGTGRAESFDLTYAQFGGKLSAALVKDGYAN